MKLNRVTSISLIQSTHASRQRKLCDNEVSNFSFLSFPPLDHKTLSSSPLRIPWTNSVCIGSGVTGLSWARFNVQYRGRVFTGQMTQPTVSKHWRKTRDQTGEGAGSPGDSNQRWHPDVGLIFCGWIHKEYWRNKRPFGRRREWELWQCDDDNDFWGRWPKRSSLFCRER